MESLAIIAEKLTTQIKQLALFDRHGKIQDPEKLHQLLDLPYAYVLGLSCDTKAYCYANTRLARQANTEAGWLPPHSDLNLTWIFQPGAILHFITSLEHFAKNPTAPRSGVVHLINLETSEASLNLDHAFPIAWSAQNKTSYFLHLFTEDQKMDLVRAHAKFSLETLTPRQHETIALLLEGKSFQKIAEIMDISPKTLEKHARVIFDLTECPNQAALIHQCSF